MHFTKFDIVMILFVVLLLGKKKRKIPPCDCFSCQPFTLVSCFYTKSKSCVSQWFQTFYCWNFPSAVTFLTAPAWNVSNMSACFYSDFTIRKPLCFTASGALIQFCWWGLMPIMTSKKMTCLGINQDRRRNVFI